MTLRDLKPLSDLSQPSSTAEQAARWSMAGQVASQLSSLLVLAMLYRLISPATFGLFAVAVPWVAMFRAVAGLGWQAVLVQATDWTDDWLTQRFWETLLVASLATVACLIASPLLRAYHLPHLTTMVAWLAPTVLLATVAQFYQGLMERRLDWRGLTRIRLTAQWLAGGTAVVVAWWGAGEVALVLQQLIEWGALVGGLWYHEVWRPTWRWNRRIDLSTWRFQGAYTVASLCFLFIQQADKLILGWSLRQVADGPTWLGMYGQAYQLSQRPTFLLTGAWGPVYLASLCRASTDRTLVRALTQRFFGQVSWILCPIMVGGIFLAPDLLQLLGGQAWHLAGTALQIFALLTFGQALVNLAGSLFTFRGATGTMAWGAAVGAILIGSVTWLIGRQVWGMHDQQAIAWMAGGTTLASIAWSLPYLWLAFRTADVPLLLVARAMVPAGVGGCVMATTVALLWLCFPAVPSLARLLIYGSVGLASYLGMVRWLLRSSTLR